MLLPPALLIFCVIAAYPVLNSAVNDDWSYAWSALDLAQTGHLHYNGWATAMIGWQLYLGAAVIKVFGFSFLALRISILSVAAVTCICMQRLLVRTGVSERNACIATMAIALSPQFQQLSFSFMSDIPGLLALVAAVYACVRAVQAESETKAALWILCGAASNSLGGTARQIAWLGVLVAIPATAFYLRRKMLVLIAGLISWALSAGFIVYAMHWFKSQPFALDEPLLARGHILLPLGMILRGIVCLLLLLLPVLIAFLTEIPGRRSVSLPGLLLLGAFIAAGYAWHAHRANHAQLPLLDNLLSTRGFALEDMPGSAPEVIPPYVCLGLTALTLASTCSVLWWLLRGRQEVSSLENARALPGRALWAILGPLGAATMVLLVTRGERGSVFDRYLIPLALLLMIPLVRYFESRFSEKLPLLSLAAILVMAGAGVALLHDMYATDRARDVVIARLVSQGISHEEIHAGLAPDAWTQLGKAGYVNDPRIRIPAGAYDPGAPQSLDGPCAIPWESETPAVRGPYVLSYETLPCFDRTDEAPLPYTTWLPPRHRLVVVQRVPSTPQP